VRKAAAALEPRLEARRATILRERLLAAEPAPRAKVGRRVSLSGERVRQIEAELQAAIRTGLDRLNFPEGAPAGVLLAV